MALEEVPIVRVLNAGVALVDQPPRAMPAGFAAAALRSAAVLGAELKDLAVPKDKAGRTVVNAASVLRVICSHQSRPLGEPGEERIPRAEIDFATGTVRLDGVAWLRADETIPADAVARDARILVDYLASFRVFFGNAAGAVEVYWAFLVWLYAAPSAPHLRQAAVPAGISQSVHPQHHDTQHIDPVPHAYQCWVAIPPFSKRWHLRRHGYIGGFTPSAPITTPSAGVAGSS